MHPPHQSKLTVLLALSRSGLSLLPKEIPYTRRSYDEHGAEVEVMDKISQASFCAARALDEERGLDMHLVQLTCLAARCCVAATAAAAAAARHSPRAACSLCSRSRKPEPPPAPAGSLGSCMTTGCRQLTASPLRPRTPGTLTRTAVHRPAATSTRPRRCRAAWPCLRQRGVKSSWRHWHT
jgi:hypothetical protein